MLAVSDKYIEEIKGIVRQLRVRNYMGAKKLYAESYKKSDLVLKARVLRNVIYKKVESKNNRKSKKEVCATHVTYCLTQNAGDTVLSWCVRRFLQFSSWNIKNVTQKVDNKLLDEINASDMLIIGGGGLFLPDTNANSISGWQWAVSSDQIEKIKVPIVFFL